MAQGQFTKEDATRTAESIELLFQAIPKSKRMNFIGELNDIFLFIDAAKNAAPNEADLQAASA
jgi:hypothetical protein